MWDPAPVLFGQEPMLYQSLSLLLYNKANEDAEAITLHSRHLRTLEKCRKLSPVDRLFFTFPLCSRIPVVFYHSTVQGLGFLSC